MKTKFIGLAVLVLLAALFISGSVFAEGEVPLPLGDEVPLPSGVEVPPAEPEEPVETAEAAASFKVAPPVEVATPEEPAAVDNPVEPALEETGVERTGSEQVAVEVQSDSANVPADAEAPASSQPELADASGDPLVLATETSAELLNNADPYFNVGAVKYCFVPDAGTCDASCGVCTKQNDPIQTAIDYIQDNGIIPTDGKIYVEADTYNYSVTIDGSLANLANLKGLIGLPDSGYIFPTINGDVTVSNTISGFTMSGFII